MLAALADKHVSSLELTELHLARIARYNPALNAIVVPAADPLAQPRPRPTRRCQGRDDRRLLGLPVTLKESMNVRGLPTTVGVPEWADYRATDDGAVPRERARRRRRAAGQDQHPAHAGRLASRQPDLRAHRQPVGRDVDTRRQHRRRRGGGGGRPEPAGIWQRHRRLGPRARRFLRHLRSQAQRDGRARAAASSRFRCAPNAAPSWASQGPLARSAEDLELGLEVVMGAEVGEDVAWRLELPPARGERLADLRVAIMPRLDWLPGQRRDPGGAGDAHPADSRPPGRELAVAAPWQLWRPARAPCAVPVHADRR